VSSLIIAYLLLFLFGLWMAIKIGRESALLGILVFFVPFIGLFYIFKNWGEDNDVRVPGLLWLLTFGWYWYSASNIVNQLQDGLPPEVIAALERGEELTPEQQAQIEANMGQLLGFDAGDFSQSMEVDPLKFKAAAIRVSSIERKRGNIVLPDAQARLEIPSHFRFLEGAALREALADSGEVFEPGFQGWIIHESIDLSKPQEWTWAIQVIARNEGHVSADSDDFNNAAALTTRARAAAARIAEMDAEGFYHSSFSSYIAAPAFDPQRFSAAWVSDLGYPDDTRAIDCTGMRLGRKTQVLYRLYAVAAQDHELCLRQVRLMANLTAFQPQQDYADVGMLDGRSSLDLAAFATDEDLVELVENQ
jgi:hypothetical protein